MTDISQESRRVALVTGAGSGIGRASAVALGAAGFAVVLAGRRAELLEDAAAEIAGRGGEALAFPADVTDPEAVAGLFAATQARFGRLDLLFNNAGTGAPPVPLEELSIAAWRRVVDLNLTAPSSARSMRSGR